MKRTLITALLLLSLGATPVMAGPTLKQQLAAAKAKVAKLQSQLAKAKSAARTQHRTDAARIQDMLRAHQTDLTTLGQRDSQILGLQTQVTQRTNDAVAMVLSGSQADIYSAVQSIWTVFPLRPSGGTCGYDKSSHVTIDAGTLVSSTYTFSYQAC
jgi:multidrug efflux pump subunit AcrA (membrane-fusion protein)